MKQERFMILLGTDPANEPSFAGWTDGDTWNGWQCPFFERAEADTFVAYWNTVVREWKHIAPNYQPAYYNKEADTYVFPDTEAPDEVDSWSGYNRDGKHLYAIGAHCWCWELAS